MDGIEDTELKVWLLIENSHSIPTVMHNCTADTNNQIAFLETRFS